MDPNQYLFDALSDLTGGLVTDLKTFFLGAVVLGFVLIGFDYLKDAFERLLSSRSYGHYLESAEDMRLERDQYRRGTREWDEANYMYRHFVGQAAKSRLSRWGK
jgi:hypothetical protein